MRKFAFLAVLAVVSCDEPYNRPPTVHGPIVQPAHEEMGPELVEKGKVLDTVYQMGSTSTTTSHTPGYNKSIDKSVWDDPMGMHSKTVTVPTTHTSVTTTVEDKFAILFECEHGKFIIEDLGKESRAGLLWRKLKPNTAVNIKYQEVFWVVPATGDRKLKRYEFVDANPEK